MMRAFVVTLALLIAVPYVTAGEQVSDPFLWLEEISSEKAMSWVAEQNRKSTSVIEAVDEYQPIYDRVLEILDSDARIPAPTVYGTTIYNFWKDERHPRGIWRRTPLASYRTASPDWETVLDVDAMAAADETPWVFKGARCLPPEYRRCMLTLSRGGSDAAVYREFDTVDKAFVEGGFELPEAKSFVGWRDRDTLWVGTDFGEGSLTSSGYPRIAKAWKRGTPLDAAETVFEGEAGDVGIQASTRFTADGRYDIVVRVPVFYRQETFLLLGGRLVKLAVPDDAEVQGVFRDRVLLSLRSDWTTHGTTYHQGALLAADLDDLLRGSTGAFDVLFEPSERVSLAQVATTRDSVVLSLLDNVRSRLEVLTPGDGGWARRTVELPGLGTAGITEASDDSDLFFYSYQDFLTPSSLFAASGGPGEKVKSTPAFFDTSGMVVTQREATSKDGTRIPYFLVTPAGFEADGTAPTLLNGYGGFEVSEVPRYSAVLGTAWLARGGVYVLANIRGGGEFGPRWHEAALKSNRIKSFEDFIAVGEDLVKQRITSPEHLGIMGGSQGGLLVGGAFTMRPELFGAAVVQVPLADMRRFNVLLAGASWMGEYGNPDVPEEWAYIKTWSPYHLLRADAEYPTPFFWTNTRDDRVHPGHARKMVAKMLAQGHPVYYFENTEGGHGSGSVSTQTAKINAMEFAYLWMSLR